MSNEVPRLSPSIAKVLIECPLKAWHQHRLLGGGVSQGTDQMTTGKLFERLITGVDEGDIVALPFNDFRTNAAKEAKAEAEANGMVAVLEYKLELLRNEAAIIREKIVARVPDWEGAVNQMRVEWNARGCDCSGVIDQASIRDTSYTLFDLKSTACASIQGAERSASRFGYDIQFAAYTQAVETLNPHLAGRGDMFFIFYETTPPYCVTPTRLDGGVRSLGGSKWQKAQRIWRECMESGVWPEYVPDGDYAELTCKPWELEGMEDTDLDEIFPIN